MDKFRSTTRIPIAEARIAHLLQRMNTNKISGSYPTQESLSKAYAQVNNSILEGFDKRIYELTKIRKGTPVNEDILNANLLGIYLEIQYILQAVRGTAEMAEENFNFAVAMIRKLQADLKYCQQNLSTFALYATNFDNTMEFGDSFSNEVNIDRGSSFLKEEECFVDLSEGNISLPRIQEGDEWEIDTIQVGEESNGILGSNVEAGTPRRGTINSMFDSNTDTWTEYERVVDQEDQIGLKMDLKIALKDIQIVNGLRIHPVFLGARTPYFIEDIEVSENGLQWISLRDSVKVADFLDETSEHRYHLAPHSSRYAGEFNITFAPRYVKFIRLIIRQSSSIVIYDTEGRRKLRYAIGIKEIKVYGHKYKSTGEIVSKQIPFPRPITAIGVQSLIDPPDVPREVGGVDYFLSFTDGSSWIQVTSLEEASLDIPEVLYPPEGTKKVRYKLKFFKDELAFQQEVEESQERNTTDVFFWTRRRPFKLNLSNIPTKGSLSVCNPDIAVRGRIYPKFVIGQGISSSLEIDETGSAYKRHGNTEFKLKLPIKYISDPSQIRIYVNSTRIQIKSATSKFLDYWDQSCVIQNNPDDRSLEVVFGNGSATSPTGRIPGPGDNISLFIEEEKLVIDSLIAPFKAKLEYATNGRKRDTQIFYNGDYYRAAPLTIPGGVTKFELGKQYIPLDGSTIYTEDGESHIGRLDITAVDSNGDLVWSRSNNPVPVLGTFKEYVSFVDGESELEDPGDWTVDPYNGVIYSKSETLQDIEYTVNFFWRDKRELDYSDWDFVPGKLSEIKIKESGYQSKSTSMSISGASYSGKKSIQLTSSGENVYGLVPKSASLDSGFTGEYSHFEVPFIDGTEEFGVRARVQDESVPESTANGSGIASFRLTHWQNLLEGTGISFDDDEAYFQERKQNYASISSVGDFYFDSTGTESAGKGYVYVKLSGAGATLPSGYTVSYQYIDTYAREAMRGAFSIDSKKGILYFSEEINFTGTKTISFSHCPFVIRYNISEQLEEDRDYTIDYDNGVIEINHNAQQGNSEELAVNYSYKPINQRTLDLGPYYSPLLRAIRLRAS